MMAEARLVKGATVEICPFPKGASFHYIAHLDGEQGIVEGIKGRGQDLKASVRLAYNRASVEFPAKALKVITPKA